MQPVHWPAKARAVTKNAAAAASGTLKEEQAETERAQHDKGTH
jgi:hypothetical protein